MQSLFLESLSGQQAQAAEVALAQAAARDAVGERSELEHMLTWLTGAHAEEAAMHRTFKAEVHWAHVCSYTAVQGVCVQLHCSLKGNLAAAMPVQKLCCSPAECSSYCSNQYVFEVEGRTKTSCNWDVSNAILHISEVQYGQH